MVCVCVCVGYINHFARLCNNLFEYSCPFIPHFKPFFMHSKLSRHFLCIPPKRAAAHTQKQLDRIMRRSKNVQFLFAYRPGEGGVVFQLKKKKNFNRRRCRTKALEKKKNKGTFNMSQLRAAAEANEPYSFFVLFTLNQRDIGTVAWQIFFVAHARIEIIQPFA